MEDKLSLLQAGRQCVGSDFTSVGVWYFSVDITKMWRHLFVQCYRFGAVRGWNQGLDHTFSLLFVVFFFVDVERSVVMCVCATATASNCLWYNVVPFCQQLQHSGGTSGRRRTQDQSERSNAQTVTLQSKSVGWTFSGWGPIRWSIGWVLAANRVRHSTDTAYHDVSPTPG